VNQGPVQGAVKGDPKRAFRAAVKAHQGFAGPPCMKSTAARKVSSTQVARLLNAHQAQVGGQRRPDVGQLLQPFALGG
jgi:hypothetical protein